MGLFTIIDDIEHVGDNFCENSNILSVLRMVGYVLTLLKVFVPIIIIIWATLKFYQAVTAGSSEALSKQVKSLLYRVGIGVMVFFVPTLIDAVLVNFITADSKKCEICVLKPFSCNPGDLSSIDTSDPTTTTKWVDPKCESRNGSQRYCENKSGCKWNKSENKCESAKAADSCANKCSAYDPTSSAYFHCIDGCITASRINTPTSASFESDSWATIAANVRSGNTSKYNVGDTKEVDLGDLGTHTVRISNMSSCTNGEKSETACGFVVEFADIITTHQFNSAMTNVGGWRDSELRTYINGTIYNALPSDLQKVISTTKVISSHGSTSGETNFETEDKLYLLSAHEVWEDGTTNYVSTNDTSYSTTKQLDYYKRQGVTTISYVGAKKQYNGSNDLWLLRSANSNDTYAFLNAYGSGNWGNVAAHSSSNGVSPAFRIA